MNLSTLASLMQFNKSTALSISFTTKTNNYWYIDYDKQIELPSMLRVRKIEFRTSPT